MKTDSQIQKDVMAELRWEPILDATEIGVAVHEGIVTLSGEVSSFFKKQAAEKAAKRVKDVKAVAIDIEVRLGIEDKRTDSEIAEAAVESLRWHTGIPEGLIKIKVENGCIVLEGTVNWNYQKLATESAVRNLKGVRYVTNNISIKPAAMPENVKDDIRKALERNADVESEAIKVEVTGNKVVLKGLVHSWQEREIAERVAWSSPGVLSVEDNILVEA